MEAFLKEVNLEWLLSTLTNQKIEVSMLLNLNDNDLIQMGVTTLGDRIRLKHASKNWAANSGEHRSEGHNISTSAHSSATNIPHSSNQNIGDEIRHLFSPYSRQAPQTGPRTGSRARKNTKKMRPWTVNFCCLSNPTQTEIPTYEDKAILLEANLGDKKIKLNLDDSEHEVLSKITSAVQDENGETIGFPCLKDIGGFELLHRKGHNKTLEIISGNMCARNIKSNISTCQSKIYIRPIQKQLNTTPKRTYKNTAIIENCLLCEKPFFINELREHLLKVHDNADQQAVTGTIDDEIDDNDIPDISDTDPHILTADEKKEEPSPKSPPESDWLVSIKKKCGEMNAKTPAEILRISQAVLIHGRELEITDESVSPQGDTNFIMVDRYKIIETAFKEIMNLEDKFLTLEIQFYGEVSARKINVIEIKCIKTTVE